MDVIDKSGEAVWGIAHRLMTMAMNYLKADDTVARGILNRMTPAPATPGARRPSCDQNNASQSLPEATGAEDSIVMPLIGQCWPTGDPDKLRAAAQVWRRAGELVDQAQINAYKHTAPIAEDCRGAAFDDFRTYEATIYTACPGPGAMNGTTGPFLEEVSGACVCLANACEGYADAIDVCRKVLIGLAAAAAAVLAAGGLLSLPTAGEAGVAAAAAEAEIVAEAAVAADVLLVATESAVAVAAIEEA